MNLGLDLRINGCKALQKCVAFTNVNDVCPKDQYPFPNIDQLVDTIIEYDIMSFIDAYLGYHEIHISPEDEKGKGHHLKVWCEALSFLPILSIN